MPAPEQATKAVTQELPDKLYFRIGEVSRLTGVRPHVLRYWETEFPMIAPKKSGRGQRLYRRKDVELILEIKRLLYEERYTIEGARRKLAQYMRQRRRDDASGQGELFAAEAEGSTLVDYIKRELRDILNLLG